MSKKNTVPTGRGLGPRAITKKLFDQSKSEETPVMPKKEILGNVIMVDTNVLINDPEAPLELVKGGNLLVIPLMVIEELDSLKRRQEISTEARQAIKVIFSLQQKNKGNLILLGKQDFRGLDDLPRTSPDNRIIATFNHVVRNSQFASYRKFKFITDDCCVLLKATKVFSGNEKVEIEQYRHIRVKLEQPRPLKPILIRDSDRQGPYFSVKRFKKVKENGAVLLMDGTSEFIVLRRGNCLIPVPKDVSVCGLHAMNGGSENWEQQQLITQLLDSSINIILVSGVAGTGKTILALAAALQQRDCYKKVVLTRPAIPLEDKDSLGFLPGDLNAKMAEYIVPFIQDLEVIIDANAKNPDFFMRTMKSGLTTGCKTPIIEVDGGKKKKKKAAKKETNIFDSDAPLLSNGELLYRLNKDGIGFLQELGITVNAVQHYRGRTYHNSFIIVDEAQNLTPLQIKTIMTRIGNNSKIVFTGDLSQIDRRFLTSETSGLAYAIAKMAGNPMVAVVNLTHTVRSKIAAFAEQVL